MGPAGAIIMSFFALVFCGLVAVPRLGWLTAWTIVPALVTSAIVVAAVVKLRNPNHRNQRDARAGRIMMWASLAEGIGLFIIVNVFINVHLAARVIPGMALVIGLHFLPMAYGIPFKRFYVLAVAILVASAVGFVTNPILAPWCSAVGSAAALWIASMYALKN